MINFFWIPELHVPVSHVITKALGLAQKGHRAMAIETSDALTP